MANFNRRTPEGEIDFTVQRPFFYASGTHQRYAWYLEKQQEDGVVSEWTYRPAKFFVNFDGQMITWQPDFLISYVGHRLYEMHIVRGFMRAYAWSRMMMVQSQYPMFLVVVAEQHPKTKIWHCTPIREMRPNKRITSVVRAKPRYFSS